MTRRTRRAALALLAAGALLASGVAAPVADGAQPRGRTVVALRAGSIEALPLLLARRLGAEARAGLQVELLDAGDGNPLSPQPEVAAYVGTGFDQLTLAPALAPPVDAFNFYRRAPVALAVTPPYQSTDLAGLVVAVPGQPSLARALGERLLAGGQGPRSVVGSGWLGSVALFSVRQVDGVLEQAPLPQYLALNGGTVAWDASDGPGSEELAAGSLYVAAGVGDVRERLVAMMRMGVDALATRTEEEIVELVAGDYPAWEPDAVQAMARVAKRSLNPSGRLSAEALSRTASLAGRTPNAATLRQPGAS